MLDVAGRRLGGVDARLDAQLERARVRRRDPDGPGGLRPRRGRRGPSAVVRAHPELLGAVAIHPNEAVRHAGVREVAADGLDPEEPARRPARRRDRARRATWRAANDRIRAIGETGLDHFRAGPAGRAVQREAFRAHIALAKELGLALQIHDRDAHDEVVEVLLADGAPDRTVFHCFSGDADLARLAVSQGWFLSFAGPVSFGPNEALRDALREVPPSQLLVETDAPVPDRAPVPRAPERAVPPARHGPDGRRGHRAVAARTCASPSPRPPRRSTARGDGYVPEWATCEVPQLGHRVSGIITDRLRSDRRPGRLTIAPSTEEQPRERRRGACDDPSSRASWTSRRGSSPRPPCSRSSPARPARSRCCTSR